MERKFDSKSIPKPDQLPKHELVPQMELKEMAWNSQKHRQLHFQISLLLDEPLLTLIAKVWLDFFAKYYTQSKIKAIQIQSYISGT